jgi:hypothetical protein
MNIRRKRPHDSLYMLLDTMCNAFGGIILLAVLVTLLTNQERESRAAAASGTQEMLQRRLALAETNLQRALDLAASLQARAADPRRREQVALLDSRSQLEAGIRQIRDAETEASNELDAAAAVDPADRAKDLNRQLSAAELRKVELQNKLKAVEDAKTSLKKRLDDLDRQAKMKAGELVQNLRLPKEYQTGKRVIYVIVEYGRIYPCRNTDLSRNETTIVWKTSGERESAYPIQGKGLDPHYPAALQGFLGGLSKDTVYLAFCVFEDSFPEFNIAKRIATAQGMAYGWEPYRNEEAPVSFSPEGHTPKPQ